MRKVKNAVVISIVLLHAIAVPGWAGSLVAWGLDDSGQVSNTPVGNDFVAVAAGLRYSVVLKSDGSLVAWGLDGDGQVSLTPAGNDFAAVAAGEDHSVALKSDGSLVAWGYDGSRQVSDTPAGNDFRAVSAGIDHSVALKADGSLVAWGSYGGGQDVSNTPAPAGNDFTAVSAGGHHNVAMKSDGSLVAWGRNDDGQINTPTGNDFAAISGGLAHNVALKLNGSLVAWGYDSLSNTPSGNDFVAVAAGGDHNVAITSSLTPTPVEQMSITKCTVTAGKTEGDDTIVFSGEMNATTDDLSANSIEVTIDSGDMDNPCAQSFPINGTTFKKGQYKCSITEGSLKTSFTFNTKTGKFSFTAENVDLSGLGYPLTIGIEIGDYYAETEVNEAAHGPKKQIPTAPTGVTASAGNGQVSISWSAVSGATSYNIYWSKTSGVTKTNGTKITGATSPYSHTGLENGTTYFYIVTAVNSTGESVESEEVSANPYEILHVFNYDNTFGNVVGILYSNQYVFFPTLEGAYADAISHELVWGWGGGGPDFPLSAGEYTYVGSEPDAGCAVHLVVSQVNAIISQPFVDPGWLTDDSVHFFLSFHIPNATPCSDWIRLNFLDKSILCNGGEFSEEISKYLLIADGYTIGFCFAPFPWSLDQLLSLPYYSIWANHELSLPFVSVGDITLTVRRGGD